MPSVMEQQKIFTTGILLWVSLNISEKYKKAHQRWAFYIFSFFIYSASAAALFNGVELG